MKSKMITFYSSLRFLGFASGFLLLFGNVFAAASGPPVNILANPGFENGMTGWGDWGGTHAITTTNVHSGTNALAQTGDGGMAQTLTNGFTDGATYVLKAWCVLPDGATGSAYIGVQSVDGASVKTTQATSPITNTASFEQQEMMFTIPAGTVSVSIFVYQEGGTTAIISDDFSFALAPENLLINPGFEDATGGYYLWERSAVQSDTVHSGTKAAIIWNMGAPDPGYTGGGLGFDYLAPEIGGSYTLTAYGKLKNDIGNDANIFIQFKDAGGGNIGIEQSPSFVGKEWGMQSVSAVIPANTVKIVCGIWFDGPGSDTLYIDDFSLTQTGWPVVAKTGTGFNYTPSYINVTGGGAMPDSLNGYTLVCDGTGATDVTACLQAALDEAKNQGKPLLIPATAGYYKISGELMVDCSIIGVGGMPTIKQTDEVSPTLTLVDNMTGWIYNLHIVGTYDGTEFKGEYAHNISLRGVNGVTISNNLLETPQGDNIGDDGAAQNVVRNVLIINNSLINPWRCNISASGLVDRCAIMNNVLTYNSQYVDPIDLEPYQDASFVTNFEIGYNDIQSPKPVLTNDGLHYYEAILQVTAWWDPTPGGNIISHHNWGDWGAPFTQVTGYQGGPSTWTNILDINNAVGTAAPGSDMEAPTVASGLTAMDVTKKTFTLSWEASADNVGVIGYLVYQDGVLVGLAASTSYDVSGLSCGKAYSMKVKAYDADGNTSAATMAFNVATSDCGGGTNLLLNPGFELPLTIGWTDDWGGSALDSTTVRSGKYSLKIENGDGGRAQLFPGLIPGGSYILSAYGMLNGTGEFYKQSAYIGVDIRDAAGDRIAIPTAPITDSLGWQQTILPLTLPVEAASAKIFVYYEARGITTNIVLTDDWSLISVTQVSGVTVLPSTVTIAEGIVTQLAAAVAPEEATNQAVTWSSSDTTIAKVSSTGMVQGMMKGDATITATTEDGGFTATSVITVITPAGNLLKNPGIEQALSVGWTGDWGNNKVDATTSHSGAKCLAIGPTDGGRAQPFTGFIPGSTYTLSAWCMVTGTGFELQENNIGADMRDASGTRIYTPATSNVLDSIGWAQYSVTFTVPMNAAAIVVFVYMEAHGITGNYILTDDWALVSGWTPLPFSGVSIFTPKASALKLYPNPLTGHSLNIEGVKGGESISIFDMTGRLVFSQKLQNAENQRINLNEQVSKGSYIVKVTGRTGVHSQLLLVK